MPYTGTTINKKHNSPKVYGLFSTQAAKCPIFYTNPFDFLSDVLSKISIHFNKLDGVLNHLA